MDTKEFDRIVQETVRDTAQLLITKGAEYADGIDRLANFKRGSQLTGTTSFQVALIYMSKHYDSICTFIRKDAENKTQVLSEPIDGRLDDLINYCILLKALIREQQDIKAPQEETYTPINAVYCPVCYTQHGVDKSDLYEAIIRQCQKCRTSW